MLRVRAAKVSGFKGLSVPGSGGLGCSFVIVEVLAGNPSALARLQPEEFCPPLRPLR